MYGIFVCTVLNNQFFTIVSLNLQMLKPVPSWIPYTVKTLYYLTLCPALTLWLMFILFSPSVPTALKWLAVLLLTVFHSLVDYSLSFAGYTQVIHWNPIFSFIRNLVDAGIVYLFMVWTRALLRRLGAAV
jgi:hypothetical protein